MNDQPDTPKLSHALAETIAWLNADEPANHMPPAALLGFIERHLPHLRVFALDMEFAMSCTGPAAERLAAGAGVRLYKRLTDIAAPLVVVRISAEDCAASLPPIDLAPFRRGSLGGAA